MEVSKDIIICTSVCCTAIMYKGEEGTPVCSECGEVAKNLEFHLGTLNIVTPGAGIHMPIIQNKSVQDTSMELEINETPDTICGRLKEAYSLLETGDTQKIGDILKICVVFAKRMSRALMERKEVK